MRKPRNSVQGPVAVAAPGTASACQISDWPSAGDGTEGGAGALLSSRSSLGTEHGSPFLYGPRWKLHPSFLCCDWVGKAGQTCPEPLASHLITVSPPGGLCSPIPIVPCSALALGSLHFCFSPQPTHTPGLPGASRSLLYPPTSLFTSGWGECSPAQAAPQPNPQLHTSEYTCSQPVTSLVGTSR